MEKDCENNKSILEKRSEEEAFGSLKKPMFQK